MRPTMLLAAAAVAVLAANAAAQEKTRARIAVLGLQAKNVDASAAATLSALLGTEITRLDQFIVLSQDDVAGLLQANVVAQVLGCEGDSCAANVGAVAGQLNAGLLVTGSVGMLGSKYVVNLSLLDAQAGKVENRASTEAPSLDDAPAAIRGAVLQLFGIAGQIALWNQYEGAQVFLNEKLIGVSPVKKIDVKREGEYAVRVYADDYTPFEQKVKVTAGEIVRVKVDAYAFRELEDRAGGQKLWGWGLVGGGGLVAGGAAVLWIMAFRNNAQLVSDMSGSPPRLDVRKPDDYERAQARAATTFNLAMSAIAASAVGLAGIGAGGWLLADNPWQKRLDKFAVAPALLPDGAVLVAAASF